MLMLIFFFDSHVTFFFLQHFIPGAHVSMGPWLGIVTQVYRKVILRVKNGSR